MKKFYSFVLSVLAIPALLLLYSYHGGSPGGKTNSPLDAGNCTECHNSFEADTAENWITSDIPEEGFTAGESYLITVTGMHEGVSLMGFELTAESSFGKVGVFELEDEVRTQFTNGDRAVTHTEDGIAVEDDSNSWTVKWTAPSVGQPVITFYAAVNAANGNGSTSGDQIYVTTMEVQEVTTGIGQDILESIVRVYPNPASSYLNIETPEDASVQVINFLGQVMANLQVAGNSLRLNVSDYDNGIYFVKITADSESITKRIVIN
jgi:hypothetical protein